MKRDRDFFERVKAKSAAHNRATKRLRQKYSGEYAELYNVGMREQGWELRTEDSGATKWHRREHHGDHPNDPDTTSQAPRVDTR